MGASMLAYDFRNCKVCGFSQGVPLYSLRRGGQVYACRRCCFHYIDHLDDLDVLAGFPIGEEQMGKCFRYIDSVLHSSAERFTSKVRLLEEFVSLAVCRCLDVGAGGGLFLNLLQQKGADVHGIEPASEYRFFARARFGLELDPRIVEHGFWQSGYRNSFDVVTLWDVIEHVNSPVHTLDAALTVLKPSGILCLDTPIRDAFLYRAGEQLYRLSSGRVSSLLEMQYSNQPFGHKQIFTSIQLRRHLEQRGLVILSMKKVHELSFPCAVYLRKLLRSRRAAAVASPLAQLFFRALPVRNKVLLVARKAGST